MHNWCIVYVHCVRQIEYRVCKVIFIFYVPFYWWLMYMLAVVLMSLLTALPDYSFWIPFRCLTVCNSCHFGMLCWTLCSFSNVSVFILRRVIVKLLKLLITFQYNSAFSIAVVSCARKVYLLVVVLMSLLVIFCKW